MGCTQGRNCPVRATRNAGVCNPEPDEEQTRDDVVAFVVLLIAMYTAVCCFVGYLWGTHGKAIESFLWAPAAKFF